MKRWFVRGLAVLAVALVALIGVALRRPSDYKIERSIVIHKSPSAVFAYAGDLANFSKWSPWQAQDPHSKITLSDPSHGLGASFQWNSAKMGEGKMTIREQAIDQHIGSQLEFFKPMAGRAEVTWTVAPEGQDTRFTWAMVGHNDTLLAKVLGVCFSYESMLGQSFEDGLKMLQAQCEKSST